MEPEIVVNLGGTEIRPKSMDEFNAIMNEWQDTMIAEQQRITDELEVSPNTASAIQYLRGRSRWTQEKEDELISRDRIGNPIPLGDVLSGEF